MPSAVRTKPLLLCSYTKLPTINTHLEQRFSEFFASRYDINQTPGKLRYGSFGVFNYLTDFYSRQQQ